MGLRRLKILPITPTRLCTLGLGDRFSSQLCSDPCQLVLAAALTFERLECSLPSPDFFIITVSIFHLRFASCLCTSYFLAALGVSSDILLNAIDSEGVSTCHTGLLPALVKSEYVVRSAVHRFAQPFSRSALQPALQLRIRHVHRNFGALRRRHPASGSIDIALHCQRK